MNLDEWKAYAEYGAVVWRRNRFGVSLSAYYSNLSSAYEWMANSESSFKFGRSKTLKGAMAAAVREARRIAIREGRLVVTE